MSDNPKFGPHPKRHARIDLGCRSLCIRKVVSKRHLLEEYFLVGVVLLSVVLLCLLDHSLGVRGVGSCSRSPCRLLLVNGKFYLMCK